MAGDGAGRSENKSFFVSLSREWDCVSALGQTHVGRNPQPSASSLGERCYDDASLPNSLKEADVPRRTDAPPARSARWKSHIITTGNP